MMKKGFTLVELLISLIIIIIITATLAPIVTKKLSKGIKTTSETKNIEMHGEIFIPFDNSSEKKGNNFECEKSSNNATICHIKNIPIPYVNAIIASGGGGGGGASKSVQAKNIETAYNGKSDKYNISNIKNVKIDIIASGGGGGGLVAKESINDKKEYIDACPEKSVAVTMKTKEEYCITKYNLRPPNYSDYHYNYKDETKVEETEANKKEIKIFSSNIIYDTTSVKRGDYTQISCWITPEINCKGNKGGYPACGRTICTNAAATLMCQELDLGGNTCKDKDGNTISCKGQWRTANKDEIQNQDLSMFWTSYMGLYGNPKNEANICSSYYDNSIIEEENSYCPSLNSYYCITNIGNSGSPIGDCTPSYIWGPSTYPSNPNYAFGVGARFSSTYSYNYNSFRYEAMSVRCVLKKSDPILKSDLYGGGGGGAGASVKNLIVPQSIIDKCNTENLGCYFNINAAIKENKYAKAVQLDIDNNQTTAQADDGTDGSASTIEIITKNGKILWGYKVEGGKKGEGAKLGTEGKGGKGGKLCYKHNGTNWSEGFDCTTETEGVGYQGGDGEDGITDEYIPDGAQYTMSGGNYGKAGIYYGNGYGGRGGYLQVYSNGNKYYNSGGQGYNGYIKITYDTFYKGASGGGGGGGAFIMLENFRIPQKKLFTIQVGGGGSAGKAQINQYSAATDGGDGSDSYISLENNLFYRASGGKGGTKGTSDTKDIPRILGQGGQNGSADKISNIDSTKISDGNKGQDGYVENSNQTNMSEKNIGGLGGRSGISVSKEIIQYSYNCGGFFTDLNMGCDNKNNENATSASFLTSKHPPFNIQNGNFGSYGAGGGGGGWSYEETTGAEKTGNGAAGQGGYIYIWW